MVFISNIQNRLRIYCTHTFWQPYIDAHLHKIYRLIYNMNWTRTISNLSSSLLLLLILFSSLSHSNNYYTPGFSLCINHSLRASNSMYRLIQMVCFVIAVVVVVIYDTSFILFRLLDVFLSFFSVLFRFSLSGVFFCYFV